MCGIFGVYNFSEESRSEPICRSRVENAVKTMEHRGPDAHGTQFFGSHAALGHRRLSIIDLREESNQPFTNDDRLWLTFNGEIYNYVEIREELLSIEGVPFKTQSDTEVLLRAYQRWGKNCVSRFNGMWAFAIYDALENTLFCSRDRFGVKPFCYVKTDKCYIFASEIKAILSYAPELRKPNYDVVANFCRTGVGAQIEETWFVDVKRLMPSHNMSISENGVHVEQYWSYPTKCEEIQSEQQDTTAFRSLFYDAVKLRMRSDVPVGTTLSAGLDSTSIVSTMREFYHQPHQTFTAKFEEDDYSKRERASYRDSAIEIDESKLALKTANRLGLEANPVTIEFNDFVGRLAETVHYLESGHSSPAVLPLMQVLKYAKRSVKVILEGQGADELLLGYITPMFFPVLKRLIAQLHFKEACRFWLEFRKLYSVRYAFLLHVRNKLNTSILFQRIWRRLSPTECVYGKKLKKYRFIQDFPARNDVPSDPINRELMRQHSGTLVNLLHYGDAISMANSIESRLPFMDYRLVEFSFRLPWPRKLKGMVSKFILRKSMEGIVSDEILKDGIKFGFSTPISSCFRKDDLGRRSAAVELLLSERCLSREVFNRKGLESLVAEHESGKKEHGTLLLRLLSVEVWFREFIDEDPVSSQLTSENT
jgi:asparagine synthase (glutamine-hydrolysing)